MTQSSLGPKVSVVIPTTGRAELARAINSVRSQTLTDRVEIIVVNDHPDRDAVNGPGADRVVWTGGRRGGGAARNLGVSASSGEYVAFLDDDDEWVPTKLEHQFATLALAPDSEKAVVSGRHIHVSARTGAESKAGPDRLMDVENDVARYLFHRRKPTPGRAAMYTSTLFCSRELALSVKWREGLTRHQDWDWLIRLARVPGTVFLQAPQVVVRVQTGSVHSISASPDWAASQRWAEESLHEKDVLVDFLVAQSLRYALNARSTEGVRSIVRTLVRSRRAPAVGPLVIGLAGLIPRRGIERLMVARAGVDRARVLKVGADSEAKLSSSARASDSHVSESQ